MAEDKKVVLKELSSDGNWYKRLFESSSDIVQRDTKPGHTVEQDLTTIENTLLGKVSGTARIYKSIGEISSSLSISSTMVSICGAMAAGSIALYGNTSGNTTIYPTDNGTILILKYSNEYCMCFYNDVESNKVYTGVYYNSASISTAKWSGWSTYAMSNHTHTAATSSTLGMVKSGGDVTISSSGIITVKDDSHNHTISNVDGLQTELSDLSAAIEAAVNSITSHANNKNNPHGVSATKIGAIPASKIGAAGGVASLDSAGKVPSSQLPSYVDDVLEFTSVSKFPKPGESGKIYTDTTTNKTYRWSGSGYTEISPSIALGETSSTAYRGDRGKTAYDHSQTTSGNPHGVTKSDVGLGNVGNYKALSTVSGQGLSSKEVTNILSNLGITATITEINYIDGVTSNIQTQLNGKAASSHGTHVTYSATAPKAAGTASAGSASTVARSDHVHPVQTTVSGNAGSATKLQTARTVRTNLASESAVSFNGTANITPGVTGVLPVKHGGTGVNDVADITNAIAAMSLAPGVEIAEDDDLDDYIDPGCYVCSSGTLAATLVNPPTTGSGFMLSVFKTYGLAASNAYRTQIALTYSGNIYCRYRNSRSVWSDWDAWDITGKNYYPTTWTWTAGTTSGPTAKLTGSGMSAVSVAAIPSASASAAGIITTGSQTIAGNKTFSSTITGSVSGNAGTATKLATPRTIRTNLGSTSTASFDGSANITPGVTGTLGIGNGGTGATTAANARTNLDVAEGYSKTATFSASGWYRIATSASGISNNIGLFSIRAAVSGKHSNVILAAGISYGDYPDIVQILTSNFSSAAITKARIVYHTTYNNNYAYLELYINTSASTTVDVSMSLCEGWTLVSPNTAGSIPSGYTSKECVLANGTIGGYTASRALVTNSSGVITESAVTSTELGYLDGVKSNIQTQLNAKAASSHTHDIEDISSLSTTLSQKQNTITGAATTILTSNLTANRALVSNSSGKVTVSAVTATELSYLDGVTSKIQTQLNAKAASSHNHNGTYVRLVDQTSQPTNQSTGDLWLRPI